MKKCEHFAVALISGKSTICRLEWLPEYIRRVAFRYWVGVGRVPNPERIKWLKEFKKFKHCPKCGEKIDFKAVEMGLFSS